MICLLFFQHQYADVNEAFKNDLEFPTGITNGAEWYCITGSLQDYQYNFNGIMSVLFEVSRNKWINSDLEKHWGYHKQSIINYLNVYLFISLFII